MNFAYMTIDEAKKSTLKHRYGAVLVYKNRAISCGYNRSLHRFKRNKYLGL